MNFPVAEVFLGPEPGREGLRVAAPDTEAVRVLAPVAGAEALKSLGTHAGHNLLFPYAGAETVPRNFAGSRGSCMGLRLILHGIIKD